MVGGAGVYAGMSALSTGYGSIQWANERDEEVWVETTVRSTGGLLSSADVVYERRYRVFPTRHTRGGDTNVVETGTYTVEVEVESTDGSRRAGAFLTRWTPAGWHHQRLIIRVTEHLSVEFRQREC